MRRNPTASLRVGKRDLPPLVIGCARENLNDIAFFQTADAGRARPSATANAQAVRCDRRLDRAGNWCGRGGIDWTRNRRKQRQNCAEDKREGCNFGETAWQITHNIISTLQGRTRRKCDLPSRSILSSVRSRSSVFGRLVASVHCRNVGFHDAATECDLGNCLFRPGGRNTKDAFSTRSACSLHCERMARVDAGVERKRIWNYLAARYEQTVTTASQII